MASDETSQVIGKVQTQDLTVTWASEPGMRKKNTDRVGILTMANGQIRLTMQSATLNLRGMRLTKGHVTVLSLFGSCGPDEWESADRASEVFMNSLLKYDITKKPAKNVIRKCLKIADKAIAKEFKGTGYKAAIAAFAGKDMTVCCVNGGRMFVHQDDGNVIRFTSDASETMEFGKTWKNVMIVSEGYPLSVGEIKNDMNRPITDLAEKRELASQPLSASVIRANRL